jgi:regulation of enolase protein 1 (concanavalin A-like superfamily)
VCIGDVREPLLHAQTAPPDAAITNRHVDLVGGVWPADFNGDGITDLVGGNTVLLGNGDGTFRAPTMIDYDGSAVATGDFNGDGKPDVVLVQSAINSREVVVALGNGDGTFGAQWKVAVVASDTPPAVLDGDLNGDGKRDVVILSDNEGVKLYPNDGTGTFRQVIALPNLLFAHDGVIADVNGDGRLDILVGDHYRNIVAVYLNEGNFTFNEVDADVGPQANDVAVADFNRDGNVDLAVARSNGGDFDHYFDEGHVSVAFGNGDGTFGPATVYTIPRGGWQVAVGDFNRDGILDIATGNRSSLYIGNTSCGGPFTYSDSVSILPGKGDGTFGPASSFVINSVNTLLTLNTSDLNGDHFTDLIVSHGTLLLNRAPAPNQLPIVTAGEDQRIENSFDVRLSGRGVDPDGDFLSFSWIDNSGENPSMLPWPDPCLQAKSYGLHTYTIVADDGHGHRATDTVAVDFVNTSPGAEFGHDDVGAVGAAGTDSFDGNAWTVVGSGADIWGTADEFHFVWTPMHGDFSIETLVQSVQNVNVWTKAGVMIRESLQPGSRHASLFVTPGKGLAFQRRTVVNESSVHTAGPVLTAPVWLRLVRRGEAVNAFYRKRIGDAWNVIGEQVFTNLTIDPLVGIAVTSHQDGTRATATFTDLHITPVLNWSTKTIGAATGSATFDGTIFTIGARGADIWGTADAFQYTYVPLEATDLSMTVRVRSLDATHAWAKAGVMFRETLDANSRHAMVVVTPGKGIALQWRDTPGGTSSSTIPIAGAPPKWLRLTRSGNTFTALASNDFTNWMPVGRTSMAMAVSMFVGLPVTSHNTSAMTTASFDDVVVRLQ